MISKFNETMNYNKVECPYCRYSYQPESEDFSEDWREEECEGCGKSYYVYQSFSVDHHAVPDCELNGAKHDYQPVDLRDGTSHPFCTVCHKCQSFNEIETARAEGGAV